MMATPEAPNETPPFVIGITNLRELAEQKGWRYEEDAIEQRVVRPDGTVTIRVVKNKAVTAKTAPTVWVRSLRPHTYEGKPQDEGSIYLAAEDIVETIEINKMGVREEPPKRAVRKPPTPKPPSEP